MIASILEMSIFYVVLRSLLGREGRIWFHLPERTLFALPTRERAGIRRREPENGFAPEG
jgi:hypothetical protein